MIFTSLLPMTIYTGSLNLIATSHYHYYILDGIKEIKSFNGTNNENSF